MAAKPKYDLIDVLANPVCFARIVLGLNLYDWQEEVMWDVARGDKDVVLAAANGSGKTDMVAAPLVAWYSATHPKGQVVTTAGVYRQVEILWRRVKAWERNLIALPGELGGKRWKINTTDLVSPLETYGVGFSTDNPYSFESWHGGPDGHLLMIFDESKAIPDAIFEAGKRCNAMNKRVLMISSTAGRSGESGRALTVKRHLYKVHVVTAYDCPHLVKSGSIDKLIEEYGREHPLVRSAIFSELMDEAEHENVIPFSMIERLRKDFPQFQTGTRWAFIDWALGGDECVIACLEGNRILPLRIWKEGDAERSAAIAARHLNDLQVPNGNVFADAGGIGKPLNSILRGLGRQVTGVNNEAKALNTDYDKRDSEHWHKTSARINKREFILPDDPVLDDQLSSRKIAVTPAGKLSIETKAQMKLRGLHSPDRADAVVAVVALCLGRSGDKNLDWSREADLRESEQYAASVLVVRTQVEKTT